MLSGHYYFHPVQVNELECDHDEFMYDYITTTSYLHSWYLYLPYLYLPYYLFTTLQVVTIFAEYSSSMILLMLFCPAWYLDAMELFQKTMLPLSYLFCVLHPSKFNILLVIYQCYLYVSINIGSYFIFSIKYHLTTEIF